MPSLSDYGCEQCFLSLVEPKTISRLADTVHHRLIGDLLKAELPIVVEDPEHFEQLLRANHQTLIVVDFGAT